MQSCIEAVPAAHPTPLAAVQAWLADRMWWEDQIRMIGAAAALHDAPIELDEPAAEPQPEPAAPA